MRNPFRRPAPAPESWIVVEVTGLDTIEDVTGPAGATTARTAVTAAFTARGLTPTVDGVKWTAPTPFTATDAFLIADAIRTDVQDVPGLGAYIGTGTTPQDAEEEARIARAFLTHAYGLRYATTDEAFATRWLAARPAEIRLPD